LVREKQYKITKRVIEEVGSLKRDRIRLKPLKENSLRLKISRELLIIHRKRETMQRSIK